MAGKRTVKPSGLDGNQTLQYAFSDSDQAFVSQNLDDQLYIKTDTLTPGITYIGKTFDSNAQDSDPVWQLTRIVVTGTGDQTITIGEGAFAYAWSDRTTVFPALPFINANSIDFDGINDQMLFPSNPNVDFTVTDSFSISAWIKPVAFAATRAIVDSIQSGSLEGYSMNLGSDDAFRLVIRGTSGNQLAVDTVTKIVDDVWTHVTCTYDGSASSAGVELYINGAIQAKTNITDTLLVSDNINNALSNFRIAIRQGNTIPYRGKIDEVSIWNKVLSPSEVSEMYNTGSPFALTDHSANANLVSWWKMGDGASFPTIPDEVGGNDATMTNMDAGDIVEDVP
jgi:hypothetical protein